MEWIKVEDKKPECISLLAVENVDDTKSEPYIMQGYYEFGVWVILTEGREITDTQNLDDDFWTVTHWQDNPKPPKAT